MTKYLPIIITAGLLAFIVTPLTRLLARRVGLVDQPGLRKAHRVPVPLMGGLAMYVALIFAFVAFGNRTWWYEGVGILGGATLLFVTGLWDDRYGMPVWVKLGAEFVAAACLITVGVQVRLFGLWWLDLPITLVWVVGITNAVNLMDNMDGLAAGVSAVAAAFFFALAALEGQGLVATLAAALFGAAVGFLFYNFAPAISFMGDAGALVLGFMLAALGIKIKFEHLPLASTWMAPIVVLGVLIFDTALVAVSRVRRGRSPFLGGSDHTSHRLVQLGLSHARTVLTIYVAAIVLGALAISLTRAQPLTANLSFAGLALVGAVLLVAFERVEPRLAGHPPLVLIPGGGGFAEALRAVAAISHDLTVLLAPRRCGADVLPSRADVVEVLAALAEDPEAAQALLARGLSDEWWRDVNLLQRVLRLKGLALVVCDSLVEFPPAPDPAFALRGEPQLDALTALRRARIILLGPGDPEINLIPVLVSPGIRAVLQTAKGKLMGAGGEGWSGLLNRWIGKDVPLTPPISLTETIQAHLIAQAAGQIKTQT
jgi:UDP-GlcNAc:undecaprenyl-phosphate/decaprenyl-phosphate GlcNAc-1-phosphate transferase